MLAEAAPPKRFAKAGLLTSLHELRLGKPKGTAIPAMLRWLQFPCFVGRAFDEDEPAGPSGVEHANVSDSAGGSSVYFS